MDQIAYHINIFSAPKQEAVFWAKPFTNDEFFIWFVVAAQPVNADQKAEIIEEGWTQVPVADADQLSLPKDFSWCSPRHYFAVMDYEFVRFADNANIPYFVSVPVGSLARFHDMHDLIRDTLLREMNLLAYFGSYTFEAYAVMSGPQV